MADHLSSTLTDVDNHVKRFVVKISGLPVH